MKAISMLVSIVLFATSASASSYDYIGPEERAAIRSLIDEYNDFLEARTPPSAKCTPDMQSACFNRLTTTTTTRDGLCKKNGNLNLECVERFNQVLHSPAVQHCIVDCRCVTAGELISDLIIGNMKRGGKP
jgi:hypothetical protein